MGSGVWPNNNYGRSEASLIQFIQASKMLNCPDVQDIMDLWFTMKIKVVKEYPNFFLRLEQNFSKLVESYA